MLTYFSQLLSMTGGDESDSFGLHQIVQKPTRVTIHRATLIDHVCVSNPAFDDSILVSVPKRRISYHFPVHISLKKSRRAKRNFKQFSQEAFLSGLQNANWDRIQETTNPDLAVEYLNNMILCITDSHAPKKIKRVKTGKNLNGLSRTYYVQLPTDIKSNQVHRILN